MIDPNPGFGNRRLCMKRNAGSGKPDHVEVVGPIACSPAYPPATARAQQQRALRRSEAWSSCRRWAVTVPGVSLSSGEFEDIGRRFVEADALGDIVGERWKPPEMRAPM